MTTAAKFKVGDNVTWTNGQGVVFRGRTVTGVDAAQGKEIRYFITPHDAPWYSIRESHFVLSAKAAA